MSFTWYSQPHLARSFPANFAMAVTLAAVLGSAASDEAMGEDEQDAIPMAAMLYIGIVGFFTGLLAVATASQLVLSHLVSSVADAFAPVQEFSSCFRRGTYVLQTCLTLVVMAVVFVAPPLSLEYLLVNGEDVGGWEVEVALATVWLMSMGVVLVDTLVHTAQSVILQWRGREMGGGVAILLAAAGASDSIKINNVVEGCRGCWYIDDIREWHLQRCELANFDVPTNVSYRPGSDTGVGWAMEVGDVHEYARQLSSDHQASIDASRASSRLAGQLSQVGAPPIPHLQTAIAFGKMRPGQRAKPGVSLVAVDVDSQSDRLYRALLNRGREHYNVMTMDRLSLGGGPMLEPRVVAIEHLHMYRRACKWDRVNAELTVRNSVLQWYRAMATGHAPSVREAVRVVGVALGEPVKPTLVLSAARSADQIDGSWWSKCKVMETALGSLAPVEFAGVDNLRWDAEIGGAHINWRRAAGGMRIIMRNQDGRSVTVAERTEAVSKPMAACWAESAVAGLDDLGHRNDWHQVTLELTGSDAVDDEVQVHTNNEPCLGIFAALDFKGGGDGVGKMVARLWFLLLIADRVSVMRQVLSSCGMVPDGIMLYLLGMEVLGLMRVATRRAGRHEIRIVVPCSQFDVCAFVEDGGMMSEQRKVLLEMGAVKTIGKQVWMTLTHVLDVEEVDMWYRQQALLGGRGSSGSRW